MAKNSHRNSKRYRTPLRYPGGKQQLAPFIREILYANGLNGGEYAEPYAGGAGIALQLLLDGDVRKVHLNDSSRAVYAFWRSILNHTDEFCERIKTVPLSIDEWQRQRAVLGAPSRQTLFDLGFSLFFLNRCNRSGIPTLRAGPIGGIKQMGKWTLGARFPRRSLIRRIRAIAKKRECIVVKNLDAEEFMTEYIQDALPENSLVYCDPPYYHQANRLYLNHYKAADHARIALVIQEELNRPWVVSYDGVQEIRSLYGDRRLFLYDLQYNVQTVRKGTEVFVFSDDLALPEGSLLPAINAGLQDVVA